eukprot:CAMPEP_0174260858 /NCGR_PEP_ID=MMETSP0439-20130205/10772_1 /TAXON_ID=0 /ORGANISM="Stereomyxa ramosa, Strain Chinc5" /LENGTH=135 /DNA_ID=CAMNT_0015345203 /DNA_START=50 /DNA_END=453 /DNA_ORIENTATION=-
MEESKNDKLEFWISDDTGESKVSSGPFTESQDGTVYFYRSFTFKDTQFEEMEGGMLHAHAQVTIMPTAWFTATYVDSDGDRLVFNGHAQFDDGKTTPLIILGGTGKYLKAHGTVDVTFKLINNVTFAYGFRVNIA